MYFKHLILLQYYDIAICFLVDAVQGKGELLKNNHAIILIVFFHNDNKTINFTTKDINFTILLIKININLLQ